MGDAESIGIVTVGIGIILAIGAIRGTWRKLFADLGVGTSSGSGGSSSAPQPGGAIITPTGKTVCYFTSSASVTCVESAAQCAAMGGTPRPDTQGACGPPVPETFPTTPTQTTDAFAPMDGNTQVILR